MSFRSFKSCRLIACLALMSLVLSGRAQMMEDEHGSHHGQSSPSGSMPPPNTGETGQALPSGSMTGTMSSGMMEDLSKPGCCGGATGKELFPWLMSLPELTPAQRQEAEQKAHQRMVDGTSLLNSGVGQLSLASSASDFARMQAASQIMREGMDQFQSGLTAHQALAENQNPQSIALQWFRAQLNLPGGITGTPRSVSLFHLFIMISLVAFAILMIGMYFQKMRRANALIAGLTEEHGADGTAFGTTLPPISDSSRPTSPPSQTPTSAEVGIAAPVPSKSNAWTGKLRVMRIFQETPTVKTFRLANPSGDQLPFVYLPGQFATITVSPQGYRTKRSYTIASSPTQLEYCELTVKRESEGVVSRFLHDQIHEGDLLEVTAPSGKFTFTGAEFGSVVFIAAGVGVTPFMSAIRYLTDRCWIGEIHLVYSSHAPSSIIFREDLEYIRRRFANVHVTCLVSETEGSSWKGRTGRITKELLQEIVPALASRHVHICGPNKFMSDVKEMLAESGVPANEVMTEIFVGTEAPSRVAGPGPTVAELGISPGGETQSKALPVITFSKSHKAAPHSPDRTVLEVSEDIGVNIDYSCRVGTCGVCKTRLLAGKVSMEVQDALTDEDKVQNIILACQAKATSDISVEA